MTQRIDELVDKLNRQRAIESKKMQCKVCWWIYDPERGCDELDIEPGIPFVELPDYFVCPNCGNDLTHFLPYNEESD